MERSLGCISSYYSIETYFLQRTQRSLPNQSGVARSTQFACKCKLRFNCFGLQYSCKRSQTNNLIIIAGFLSLLLNRKKKQFEFSAPHDF